ncbi:unnamed protein product, partial [Prorocentrum cordatum]
MLVPKLLGVEEDDSAEGAAGESPQAGSDSSEDEEHEPPEPRAAPRGLSGLLRWGRDPGPGPNE